MRILSIETADAQSLLEYFAEQLAELPRGIETVLHRAINRTLEGSRTDAGREIREEYNVRAGDVAKAFRLVRASRSTPMGELIARGPASVPLYAYSPRPNRPGLPRPKGGVSVQVTKGGGRKQIKSTFVARMESGHTGVFEREGKGRFPVRELFGPGILHVLQRDDVIDRLEDQMNDRLWNRLEHEADYLLKQAGLR